MSQAASLFAKVGTSCESVHANQGEEKEEKKNIIQCVPTVAREKKVMKILDKLASLEKTIQDPQPRKKVALQKGVTSMKSKVAVAETPSETLQKIPLIIDERKNHVVSSDFAEIEN